MTKKSKNVKRKINKKKRTLSKFLATLTVLIFICVALACYLYPPLYDYIKGLISDQSNNYVVDGDVTIVKELKDLKVHFVDVGQGDCIIIELPDGKNVIIDSGESDFDDLDSYIKENTSVTCFDYVIATHADYDHIGNFDDLFKNYEVKYVYRPYVKYDGEDYEFSGDFNKGSYKYQQDSKSYGRFLDYILNEDYVIDGKSYDAGWEFFNYNSDFAGKIKVEGQETEYEYYFDFLTPKLDDLSKIEYKDANDYSPIIKFSYCGVDIMFTGDAEAEAEADFVKFYKGYESDLDVEILKVSHHGSLSSTTQDFLDLIKPDCAVIQCGLDNDYLHPRQATLTRLFNKGCTVYRNDLQGDILLTINSNGEYGFATEKTTNSNLYKGADA